MYLNRTESYVAVISDTNEATRNSGVLRNDGNSDSWIGTDYFAFARYFR